MAWLEINGTKNLGKIYGLLKLASSQHVIGVMLTLGSFGDVLFGCLTSFWTAEKFAIALCILHLEVSVVHNGWQSQSMKVVLALAIILPALAAKLPRTSMDKPCLFFWEIRKDHMLSGKNKTQRCGFNLNQDMVSVSVINMFKVLIVERMLTTRSDSLEPGKVMGSWDKRER